MADYAIHEETLTDIADVLRKKDGSVALIDPSDFAAKINLLGPLPEKTVSSSPIVAFSDGADAVPLKKCEVTLPASLDEYSEVDMYHTGSNLWDEITEPGAINVVNGQNVANNNFIRSTNYIPVLPNTTYYKCAPQNYLQLYYGKDKTYLSYGSWNKNTTFTTPPDCYFVRFYVAQEYGTTYNNDIALNYPSTFTEYAHYSGDTHTASLGRTIHGGTVDVVAGSGESTHGLYTFTGNEVYVQQTNQVAIKVAFTVGSSYQTGLDTAMSDVEDFVAGGCGASNYLYVKTTMTAEDLKTYMANHTVLFAYVLATPETFTFDPISIDSKLGNNTIWSEQGDTEVTYRADINLALGE